MTLTAAIDISLSDTKIQFCFNGVELTSKLIDGNFPGPMSGVIPSGKRQEPGAGSQGVRPVCWTAFPTISADKTLAVKLNLSKDKVTLSVVKSGKRHRHRGCGCHLQRRRLGDRFSTQRYLLDITSQIEGKEVRFLLSGRGFARHHRGC